MKTRRLDYSQGSIQSDEARVKNSEVGLDRTVYASISNITDNKIIVTPEDKSSSYNRWLLDMNKFTDTGVISPELDELDTYLGTLGVTEDYPYSDDTYGIKPWLVVEEQEPFRNILHATRDNNHNVISSINIIDRATGSNLIHDTRK